MVAAWQRNFRKHLPLRGRGRLLDFGCGGGSFLERMHDNGWQVTGVDIAAAAVERIRNQPGLHALVGTLPHADLPKASFDVITMWESLEHVHRPLEVLRAAHELLAPQGQLIVATPNIDSLAFRWFGRAWWGLDVPRHLSHFNPWTLQMMLNRAGFRTSRVRMVRHSSWLRRSAERMLRDQNDARSRWLARRWPSGLVAWLMCLARRGDCILTVASRAAD
jgi:SAM-dependent methyltransferase